MDVPSVTGHDPSNEDGNSRCGHSNGCRCCAHANAEWGILNNRVKALEADLAQALLKKNQWHEQADMAMHTVQRLHVELAERAAEVSLKTPQTWKAMRPWWGGD